MEPDRLAEWVRNYGICWERADADGVARLFSERATYRSHVFRELYRGRAGITVYWKAATASQHGVRVQMGDPVQDGGRAAVEWWTTMGGGQEITLPGVLLLRFGE